MNLSVILQVAIPTFIFMLIGIGLTISEFHKDFKRFKKPKSKRSDKA